MFNRSYIYPAGLFQTWACPVNMDILVAVAGWLGTDPEMLRKCMRGSRSMPLKPRGVWWREGELCEFRK
jgi:hypothetical protein